MKSASESDAKKASPPIFGVVGRSRGKGLYEQCACHLWQSQLLASLLDQENDHLTTKRTKAQGSLEKLLVRNVLVVWNSCLWWGSATRHGAKCSITRGWVEGAACVIGIWPDYCWRWLLQLEAHYNLKFEGLLMRRSLLALQRTGQSELVSWFKQLNLPWHHFVSNQCHSFTGTRVIYYVLTSI